MTWLQRCLILTVGILAPVLCDHNYYEARVIGTNKLVSAGQGPPAYYAGLQKVMDWACSLCRMYQYQCHAMCFRGFSGYATGDQFWYGHQKFLDWACSLCWYYPYQCHPACYPYIQFGGYGNEIYGNGNYGLGNRGRHGGFGNYGYTGNGFRDSHSNYGYGSHASHGHGHRSYRPFDLTLERRHSLAYKPPMKPRARKKKKLNPKFPTGVVYK